VSNAGKIRVMAERVRTADELELMTPGERHDLFESSLVWDLELVPEVLLLRTRQVIEQRIAAVELPKSF
jgi:hypothetical protein